MTTVAQPAAHAGIGTRAALIGAALALSLAVAVFAGARYGFLLVIGLGFGIALEGLRFGFAGPWRAMILRREAGGLLAQLLAIGLVALAAFPLLSSNPGELTGAHAPVGIAMVGGAFVFGVAMQLVLGCGSGTLVNAGSGNAVSYDGKTVDYRSVAEIDHAIEALDREIASAEGRRIVRQVRVTTAKGL